MVILSADPTVNFSCEMAKYYKSMRRSLFFSRKSEKRNQSGMQEKYLCLHFSFEYKPWNQCFIKLFVEIRTHQKDAF